MDHIILPTCNNSATLLIGVKRVEDLKRTRSGKARRRQPVTTRVNLRKRAPQTFVAG